MCEHKLNIYKSYNKTIILLFERFKPPVGNLIFLVGELLEPLAPTDKPTGTHTHPFPTHHCNIKVQHGYTIKLLFIFYSISIN
jgi:hypothetical protein